MRRKRRRPLFLVKSAIKANKGYAVVDRELFLKIVVSVEKALGARKIFCNYKEFLGFCLKVYKQIEPACLSENNCEMLIDKLISEMMEE